MVVHVHGRHQISLLCHRQGIWVVLKLNRAKTNVICLLIKQKFNKIKTISKNIYILGSFFFLSWNFATRYISSLKLISN